MYTIKQQRCNNVAKLLILTVYIQYNVLVHTASRSFPHLTYSMKILTSCGVKKLFYLAHYLIKIILFYPFRIKTFNSARSLYSQANYSVVRREIILFLTLLIIFYNSASISDKSLNLRRCVKKSVGHTVSSHLFAIIFKTDISKGACQHYGLCTN